MVESKPQDADQNQGLVNGQFKIIKQIGEGSFGKVYLAQDTLSGNKQCAIKTESLSCRFPQLLSEMQCLKTLKGHGFPRLMCNKMMVDDKRMMMATELLGPTLEDLFNFCGRNFSIKTCLMIFYQILQRLEHIHSRNMIHRDIKPDNILSGIEEKSSIIHMIDFGLTRSILNKKTGRHIDFRTGKNLVGTARFVSINAHLGYELSRRDDLLTLGYVMVYFTLGQLPWQYVDTRRKSARFTELGRMKQSYSTAELCKDCPKQYQ